jgi:hypothetical protein
MKKARGLAASVCALFCVVSLSGSAGAFSYRPWITGPARTLGIVSLQANAETGELVLNGVDSRAPATWSRSAAQQQQEHSSSATPAQGAWPHLLRMEEQRRMDPAAATRLARAPRDRDQRRRSGCWRSPV